MKIIAYYKNSIGKRVDPCSAPQLMSVCDEVMPFIVTVFNRIAR